MLSNAFLKSMLKIKLTVGEGHSLDLCPREGVGHSLDLCPGEGVGHSLDLCLGKEWGHLSEARCSVLSEAIGQGQE